MTPVDGSDGVMAMDDMLKGIGDRVRQARAKRHMSQMDLAEAAGLSTSFISNVEMGRQSMNIRALVSISNVLGVSTDWLLRNDTQAALHISSEELYQELSDCTPQEREAILKVVQSMKDVLQTFRKNSEQ